MMFVFLYLENGRVLFTQVLVNNTLLDFKQLSFVRGLGRYRGGPLSVLPQHNRACVVR